MENGIDDLVNFFVGGICCGKIFFYHISRLFAGGTLKVLLLSCYVTLNCCYTGG